MQIEIEGQEIIYKDLPELREKLTSLLGKTAQERELHEREGKRLRHQEKKIRAFLGDSGAAPASADVKTESADKGAGHE